MRDETDLASVTDALARGRLTLAEIAGFSRDELDALYALALERLDANRLEEATAILAGLATLFPYAPHVWRAFGVALHHQGQWERARAAYQAALLLEPDEPATLAYRGEVLLYLGEHEAARADLTCARDNAPAEIRKRAGRLLAVLDACAEPAPAPPRQRHLADEEPTQPFVLADARVLPLADSRFAELERHAPERPITEVTQTARILLPTGEGPASASRQEVTTTARVDRRRLRRESADTAAAAAEITHTAIVRRRRHEPLTHEDD